MAGKIRYLKERNGRYSARLVVPKSLRALVGTTELEYQLGGDRRQAIAKLPGAVAALQSKIAVAEQKPNFGKTPAVRYHMTVGEIAFANYQSMISFDQEIRDQDPRFANLETDDGLVADLRAGMAGRLDDEMLEQVVGYRIDRFRTRGNTDVTKGSPEWRVLAIALCVSEYEALSRKAERDEGDFAGRPSHPQIANASPITDLPTPVPLLGLLDAYLKELEHSGKGREARKRWTPVFKHLAKFVRHDDAARLTKKQLMDWRDALLETLAPKTVADVYLASVRAVLAWAAVNDRIPTNPADGVKVRRANRVFNRERGFRDDEATDILRACQSYVPATPKNPSNREARQTSAAKKWTSLLCAFTGARIVEVTQLRKQDVRHEGGLPFIRFTPEAGSIKTGQYRDIPLHRQIVDLGFLDFVKSSMDGPLFHSAKPEKALQGARTTSGCVSKWLNEMGIIPDGVSPNHGWRHRFKTIGREAEVSDRVLDAIQGHAARTAGDEYGDVTIVAKHKGIEKLPSYVI